jgi:hypothetical protein
MKIRTTVCRTDYAYILKRNAVICNRLRELSCYETISCSRTFKVPRIARYRARSYHQRPFHSIAPIRGRPNMDSNKTIRPGELLAALPDQLDAGVYFIGRIRTPWATRDVCPRRGDPTGPECRIEIDPRWERALEGLVAHPRIEVLYWMHQARRDLLIQVPRMSGNPLGTFALRSPVPQIRSHPQLAISSR